MSENQNENNKVSIDLEKLPQSMQRFHINSAINKNVTLEEHLLEFIRVQTGKEQDQISTRVRQGAKDIESLLREMGVKGEDMSPLIGLDKDSEE